MRKNLKNIWHLQVHCDSKLILLESERPWSALWVRAALMRFNYDLLTRALKARLPDYRATLYYFCMREFAYKCKETLTASELYKLPDYEVAMHCVCKQKLLRVDDPLFDRGRRIYLDEVSPTIKGKWTEFKAFVAIVKYFDKSYRG